MTKIPGIIVDDERLARVNLRKLLEPYSGIRIVGEAGSCREAVHLIHLYQPQLIFLDIQLIGESGFDLLDKIDPGIQVIFVTAYDEYAIRAFEINAVDYLLKPVNPERLKKTMERVSNPGLNNGNHKTKFEYTDSVYVKMNGHTSKFLKISSIVSITPVGNYTKLFVNDDRNYIVLKTMKQWEDELPGEYFLRIHRSSIVNIEYIRKIEQYSSKYHRLYLKNKDKYFEISRRYLTRLKNNYKV